jgi:trehalose 6-phosphate synthase/phosphatase
MDQKEGAPDGAPAHQAGPADSSDIIAPRPIVPDRAESFLPPHLRPSVTQVPVTPGITREAYDSEGDRSDGIGGVHRSEPGYFSRHDFDHAIAASPAPDATNQEGQSFQNKIDTGAQEGSNFMRRLSIAVMGHHPTTSKESMSDIRAISPDLSLTGNIISATFNLPHSLKYRKGADWVSSLPFCHFFSVFPSDVFSPFRPCICPSMRAACDTSRLPSLDERWG